MRLSRRRIGSGPRGLSAFGFVHPPVAPGLLMAAGKPGGGFVLDLFFLTGEEREGIRSGVYGRERGGMKAGGHDSLTAAAQIDVGS